MGVSTSLRKVAQRVSFQPPSLTRNLGLPPLPS